MIHHFKPIFKGSIIKISVNYVKSFTSKYGLKDHFVKRKNPCIKDKTKWEKKLKYLPSTPKQITFDKYQKEFIESELDDGKLLGVPGGGKTRCIVEKNRKTI